MEHLYLQSLFLLLTFGWAHSQTPELCDSSVHCPRDGEGNCIDGNLSNPYDCYSFCSCTNCVAVRQYCPGDLVYNPNIDQCVQQSEYPTCYASVPPRSQTALGWAHSQMQELCDSSVRCPRDGEGGCLDGNLSNPYDCHSFCSCTNCVPVRQYCPEDLVYNPNIDHCVRQSEYPTCYASVPVTTPRPQTDVAICAVRRQELLGVADPMPFDYTLADFDGRYGANHTVRVLENGFYLHSISAAAGQLVGLDLSLRKNGAKEASLLRHTPRTVGPDTSSRDFLAYYNTNDELRISSQTDRVYSDGGHLTSWSLFSITEMMTIDILFSVSRTTSFSTGVLHFDTVHGDIGGGWNLNTYRVPWSGVYYFSLSTGVATDQVIQLHIYRNNAMEMTALIHEGRNTNGVTTVSRSFMLSLQEGDTIHVQVVGEGFSNALRLTSFSGMLYNPFHDRRVAWSVVDTRTRNILARQDPLDFNTIVVNEGNAYNSLTHYVNCTISGLYYVHMSFASVSGARGVMELLKNAVTQAHLTRDHEWGAGPDTYSRSLILQCAARQRLHIAAQESSFSGNGRMVSFSGFLLYPN